MNKELKVVVSGAQLLYASHQLREAAGEYPEKPKKKVVPPVATPPKGFNMNHKRLPFKPTLVTVLSFVLGTAAISLSMVLSDLSLPIPQEIILPISLAVGIPLIVFGIVWLSTYKKRRKKVEDHNAKVDYYLFNPSERKKAIEYNAKTYPKDIKQYEKDCKIIDEARRKADEGEAKVLKGGLKKLIPHEYMTYEHILGIAAVIASRPNMYKNIKEVIQYYEDRIEREKEKAEHRREMAELRSELEATRAEAARRESEFQNAYNKNVEDLKGALSSAQYDMSRLRDELEELRYKK